MPQAKYFDRDLSWLSFNQRVLLEAADPSLPLYERIKFLAIYSSNLDEFFRVRITSVRSLLGVKKKKRADLDYSPELLYKTIFKEINQQLELFGKIFQEQIVPELASNNIILHQSTPMMPEHVEFVRQFFEEEVSPFLHPELLRRKRIRHFLRDNVLYLAVKMYSRSENSRRLYEETGDPEKKSRRAIILIPTQYLPRFVELPKVGNQHHFIFLDDVIRFNLDRIFVGYDVVSAHTLKLNRNADIQIEDEFSGDLVEKIQKSLSKRHTGNPSRFLYDRTMPEDTLRYLMDTFFLTRDDLVPGGRYHNFHDFFAFPNPLAPLLERSSQPGLRVPDLDRYKAMADAMSERSWLLHFPYNSYDYVLRFLNGAATDPSVKTIRTTQYRVASNSAIVNALVRCAQNEKAVTVFVELKARFDEQANLNSAEEMRKAGVNIIYSLPGLKVHAKIALVEREEEGKLVGYAFLSTGNFNEKTARIYGDHGYLTKNEIIIQELKELFAYLDNQDYQPQPFQKLLVAQFNLREGLYRLIDREIAHAREGRHGQIVIKLNNLEDRGMIDKLYEASAAGVWIELIVRGICCLRPEVPGLSDHIRVTRIVDQYLEHARVFVFYNEGAPELYLGSADWMVRNLERRIEVVFPVGEEDLRAEVMEILRLQLLDNVKAVRLDKMMKNHRKEAVPGDLLVRSQAEIYERIKAGRLLTEARPLFPLS